jgi:hypothetical protein
MSVVLEPQSILSIGQFFVPVTGTVPITGTSALKARKSAAFKAACSTIMAMLAASTSGTLQSTPGNQERKSVYKIGKYTGPISTGYYLKAVSFSSRCTKLSLLLVRDV